MKVRRRCSNFKSQASSTQITFPWNSNGTLKMLHLTIQHFVPSSKPLYKILHSRLALLRYFLLLTLLLAQFGTTSIFVTKFFRIFADL